MSVLLCCPKTLNFLFFQVNPSLISHLEQKDLSFVGQDVDGERMEIIELANHPYFVGVQFHPEFSSRPMKPSPPYPGLLLAATGNLNAYLLQGCKLSSSDRYRDASDDSCSEPRLAELEIR